MITDLMVIIEACIVVNVDLFICWIFTPDLLTYILDVNLCLYLIQEAFEQGKINFALLVEFAAVRSVCHAGPDHPFEDIVGVYTSEIVVDARLDLLLLLQ